MRKFVKIQSIDAEEMDLGTALKEGLVTMPKDTKPEDYDESWPGYHTVMAKVVHMNGTVEREESWLPEEDFNTEWPREVVDDEFGWGSMAALSINPGTKIYAEFHENQIRYQRALTEVKEAENSGESWKRMVKEHMLALRCVCMSYIRKAVLAGVYITVEKELAEFVSEGDLEKIESFKAKIDKK